MPDFNQEQLEELSTIVAARVSVLSPDTGISIGSSGSFKRDELIAHIEKKDEIGRQFIAMDWQFLQSLKDGKIYDEINDLCLK